MSCARVSKVSGASRIKTCSPNNTSTRLNRVTFRTVSPAGLPHTFARKKSKKAASTEPRLRIMPPDCCCLSLNKSSGRHQSSPPISTCTTRGQHFGSAERRIPIHRGPLLFFLITRLPLVTEESSCTQKPCGGRAHCWLSDCWCEVELAAQVQQAGRECLHGTAQHSTTSIFMSTQSPPPFPLSAG